MQCPRCKTNNREGELICSACSYPLVPVLTTRKLDSASGDVLPLPATGDTRLLDKMKLRFIIGEKTSFDVEMGEQVSLGRVVEGAEGRPDVDLSPYNGQELGVSKFHCVIKRVGSNLTIQDSSSTNGTWLNGQRLNNGDPHFLHDGDSLFLGHLPLAVYFVR